MPALCFRQFQMDDGEAVDLRGRAEVDPAADATGKKADERRGKGENIPETKLRAWKLQRW